MIGEGEGTSDHNNTVDIIFQSVQRTIDVKDNDGNMRKEQVLDDLSLWCKTLSVATNKLGQLVHEMMEFARYGMNADKNMCSERAVNWQIESMAIVESVKKALDSKSSESMRNKENSQSTLIDKVNKNSIEKIYTMKEKAKGSIFDSIMGKERDKMSDD